MSNIVLSVDNNVTYLSGRLGSEVYKDLKKELGYKPEQAHFLIENHEKKYKDAEGNFKKGEEWREGWDGTISTLCWNRSTCKCNIKKKGTHFPTGLLNKACEVLKRYNINYSFKDLRQKYDYSDDLSMSDEFEIRDYQQEVIEVVSKVDRGIIKAATGSGKCINKNSIIFTKKGMLTFDELSENLLPQQYEENKSEVYTPLTKELKDYSSHLYRDGENKSFFIRTSRGYTLTGTPNHKVKVINENGEMEWKKLKSIKCNDYIVISSGSNLFGESSELSEDDCLLLGLLYGDGCLSLKDRTAITTADDYIEKWIREYSYSKDLKMSVYYDKRRKKTRTITIGGKNYRNELFKIGIKFDKSYEKEIPEIIRRASKEKVASFLRGLYETDGWVGKSPSVCIGLSNYKLIQQIQIILLNFGIISSIRKKKAFCNGKRCRDSYILTFYKEYIGKFIKEIGFYPNERKYIKLNKYFKNSKNNNSYNCNKNLIPKQSQKISSLRVFLRQIWGYRNLKKEVNKSPLKFATFRSWYCAGKWNRFPSRYNLVSFLCYIKDNLNTFKKDEKIFEAEKLINDMLLLCNNNFYYDKIIEIEEVISDNYDFIIPNSHSFVAQGFINHNTSIASGIISKIGIFPTVFYVPSIDLMLQSKNEMEKFIRKNGERIKVGMVGGGKKDIQDITVMTIQTAVRSLGGVWVKYDEENTSKDDTNIEDMKENIVNLIKSAKLIIADEIQHWSAETCQIISDNSISARHKWGMSATPWRDQGDDILIDGCFGKCFADISASLLIKKKYLVKPYINIINISKTVNIKKKSYPQIYKYGIVENELRNNYIKNIAETYYENGRNILILVKQIAHGKLLEKMIPNSFFIYGNHSMKKREKHLEKMRNGEARLTISSVIFDEGIDCKVLDTLILAGSGKSPTRALQRVGRVLRTFPNKENAIVVDFFDNYKYLKDHSSKRIKMYRTEPEFVIRTISS